MPTTFQSSKKEHFGANRKDYTKLASDTSTPLFVANVEAPWDILVSRFEKRVELKRQGVKKIANIDPNKFKDIYDAYIDTNG